MAILLATGGFCFAFLLALTLNWFALRPWRKSVGLHWMERARLLHPARISARINSWLIPVAVGMFCYLLCPDQDFLLAALPGFIGTVFANHIMSREVVPDLRFKAWLHLLAASLFLFFLWWAVLIFTIMNMPLNFGFLTWLVAGGVLILLLSFNFGLGILLLRWFRLVQPATEHLQALVAEVSLKMGVPVRATWILSTYISNALAFPLTRQLMFTDKLLATLTDDEIKAVCAHELGHLNEPRKVLIMRLLVAMAFYPLIFARPMSSLGEMGTSAFWLLLIGVLIVWLVGIRVSRRMETRADKIAVENQADAAVYARALERLYQTNQMPAVMPKRSSKIHPDLYDRMIAAGVTPDYPKPAPAKGQCWTSRAMLFAVILSPIATSAVKLAMDILDAAIINTK
jgi:Zn-dependent protease with chaperone function